MSGSGSESGSQSGSVFGKGCPNLVLHQIEELDYTLSGGILERGSNDTAVTSCNAKQDTSFFHPCSEVIYSMQ